MRTIKELLVESFRRGRAWDPSRPNLLNLDLTAVQKMNGTEQDAKELIASLQMSDINILPLVSHYHKRDLIADGNVGPATQDLVSLPRCPLPDFAPPPNASFHYDDPGLQKAVVSMQQFSSSNVGALGTGSWPKCDPNSPEGFNSFRVGLNTSRIPSGIKVYLAQALQESIKCYAEMGAAVRYILDSTEKVEITKKFENLSGSIIGWNEFPNPGTCNQTIEGRLDTGYVPEWRLWANLEVHETGHGVGLQHTRGHIMNPSIVLVWPLSWKGGPSEASMKRYFGGEPVNIGPTPDPVVQKPIVNGALFIEEDIIRGSIDIIVNEGQKAGKFPQYISQTSPGRFKFIPDPPIIWTN